MKKALLSKSVCSRSGPRLARVSGASLVYMHLLCLLIASQLSFEVVDLCAFFAEVVVK